MGRRFPVVLPDPQRLTTSRTFHVDVIEVDTHNLFQELTQNPPYSSNISHQELNSSSIPIMLEGMNMSHNGCPKCGASITAGSKKCGSCGAVSIPKWSFNALASDFAQICPK